MKGGGLEMKLYEISEQYKEFLSLYEYSDIPEDAKIDTFDSIECEFKEKVDNIACFIKNLRAEAEAIKNEIKTLEARMKSKIHKSENLTRFLKFEMSYLNKDRIETPRNKITIKKNPESVWVSDEFVDWASSNSQEKFLKFKKPEPNKTAIKEAINSGEIFSFAHLIQTERLEIK